MKYSRVGRVVPPISARRQVTRQRGSTEKCEGPARVGNIRLIFGEFMLFALETGETKSI